ncbi:MAG TPA: hypothetical protein VEZ14_14310 [Dehalococcoidia bacterium]|nr:hypothetical protein [Dehalococcoidia bacterium]
MTGVERAAKPAHSLSADEIRDVVLHYLYDLHASAKGMKSQGVLIRDLQSVMKERHGLKQHEVASQLDYLLDKHWVREDKKARLFTTKYGTTQSSEQVRYKISAEGIDRIEGESAFGRVNPYEGINIQNVTGVVNVGSGNYVNASFGQAAQELDALRRAINASELTDDDKFAAVNEIQTIDLQLAKKNPDAGIVARAWGAIEKVANAGTLVDLATRAGVALAPILSQVR